VKLQPCLLCGTHDPNQNKREHTDTHKSTKLKAPFPFRIVGLNTWQLTMETDSSNFGSPPMCVCVCVYTYIWMYACICVHMCMHTHLKKYIQFWTLNIYTVLGWMLLPDLQQLLTIHVYTIYLNFSLFTNFFPIYLITFKCLQFKLHSAKTHWVKGNCIYNMIHAPNFVYVNTYIWFVMLQILLADELYKGHASYDLNKLELYAQWKLPPCHILHVLGFNPGHHSETSALGKVYI
jgi:hypothetical protein